MAQKWKVEKVDELRKEIKGFSSFVFTNYRGLNVQQINSLRNDLRGKGAEFHVVKNRMVKRVFNDMGLKEVDEFLVDPTALAYFNTDISEIVKILVQTAEDTSLQLKGGYTDGTVLSAEEMEKISNLPSRMTLIGQTVGLLNAPISDLIFVLGGVVSKFVRTLKTIEESKRAN
jgi:large subunit ribosomal protein L10